MQGQRQFTGDGLQMKVYAISIEGAMSSDDISLETFLA
jgi:hypothetical protein